MSQALHNPDPSDRDGFDIFRTRGWLTHVDRDFADALLDRAVIKRFAPGQSLSFAGDEHGSIWGVVEGQVDFTGGVSLLDAPVSDIALAGEWWGFRPLQTGPRAVHAVARTEVTVAAVSLTFLSALLNQHPGWWRHIATVTALKQERWGSGMLDMTIKDSRLRCTAVLLRLGHCRYPADGNQPVTIAFTQDQLATAANLSRYPTGTILRDLAKAGLVRLGYGTITILEPAKLRNMVNEANN